MSTGKITLEKGRKGTMKPQFMDIEIGDISIVMLIEYLKNDNNGNPRRRVYCHARDRQGKIANPTFYVKSFYGNDFQMITEIAKKIEEAYDDYLRSHDL